ncbi:MAG TPA: M23 family metallopeptidase [Planctomycetota bacterium]|nr:M23 family metallopeptidase [Planctomycetota bacterium]
MAILAQLLIVLSLPLAGEAPKWPFVLDSTYEQRVAVSPRNKVLDADSLVLPQAHATNVLPEPIKAKAGSHAVRYPERDWVVWEILPWQAVHEEYRQKRKELLPQGQLDGLIDWCLSRHLPACAEFELRAKLLTFKSFGDPGYGPLAARWLKLAQRRQVACSFPLPFRGTWFVAPDRTGHHRIKAGAAFAYDFIIQKNGKPHSGSGLRLADHYAWDQPILAQADGVVRSVADQFRDVPINQSGGYDKANSVAVDYGGGILGFYGHLRQGSAKVKAGERVKAGQELARAGNSGASGMPHIHFTFLDHAHFSLRGRYRCEIQGPQGWQLADGQDLREGAYVRNAEGKPKE